MSWVVKTSALACNSYRVFAEFAECRVQHFAVWVGLDARERDLDETLAARLKWKVFQIVYVERTLPDEADHHGASLLQEVTWEVTHDRMAEILTVSVMAGIGANDHWLPV